MQKYEEIIGEATRMEYDNTTGQLFLVFEIINEKMKQKLKNDWTQDIEVQLVIKESEKN